MRIFKSDLEKKFYKTWGDMKNRCKDTKRLNYGARGIKVCDRWMLYVNFKKDMWKSFLQHIDEYGARQTTLDRIDPNGNYEKSNCRWSTYKEQRLHVRNKAVYEGINVKTGDIVVFNNCSEFCKEHGLLRSGVFACCAGTRIKHKGWKFRRLTEKEGK